MKTWLGVILAFSAIVATAWWICTGEGSTTSALALCTLAVFTGIVLILSDRIVEVSMKGVGTIKAAAKQAVLDAREIAEMRQRIEAQSATVNLVAREAAEARGLVDEVISKNQKAEQKIAVLDKAISEGTKAVSELKTFTEFNSTVLLAQNDDRRAYDQLLAWAKRPDHLFHMAAVKAIQTIMDQHDPPMIRMGFTVPWKEGIDPQKLTLTEIKQTFKESPPHIRIGILEFLCEKRKHFSKKDRLSFLVDVLRTDESLKVIEYAGRWFTDATGEKLKPLAIESHLSWWEENEGAIKNES